MLVDCCNETIVVSVASMLWVLASVKLEDEASVLGSSQLSMCYGIIDLHVLKVLEGTPQWLSLRTHVILLDYHFGTGVCLLEGISLQSKDQCVSRNTSKETPPTHQEKV